MDVHEVPVGQFRKFVEQSGYDYPDDYWEIVFDVSLEDDYPMVYVNWNDAMVYAKWAEKRLPTEAEWEFAARGGLRGKRYPWGNGMPTGKECNFADKNANAVLRALHKELDWANIDLDDGHGMTAPVGSFEPNGYSLHDMVGNVREWCADWHAENYYSVSPIKNPLGPDRGFRRVFRGGSWYDTSNTLHVASRFIESSPTDRKDHLVR